MLETTDILISTALISKLIEGNVRIVVCDEKHNPAGEIHPYYGSHDSSKKINQQIIWDDLIKQEIWTKIIRQKIFNQYTFLKQLNYEEQAEKLLGYMDELELYDPTNREGHAAKVYFNALFGKNFSRDDDDDVNAFLNYGYTLILSVFNREIIKNGHLTQIGLKHSNYFNPYNLSSDIMEPFRVIVDQKVVSINNRDFSKNKHSLFKMFEELYLYNKQKMYLTNIIEHYVKKVLKALDKGAPEDNWEFKISEL